MRKRLVSPGGGYGRSIGRRPGGRPGVRNGGRPEVRSDEGVRMSIQFSATDRVGALDIDADMIEDGFPRRCAAPISAGIRAPSDPQPAQHVRVPARASISERYSGRTLFWTPIRPQSQQTPVDSPGSTPGADQAPPRHLLSIFPCCGDSAQQWRSDRARRFSCGPHVQRLGAPRPAGPAARTPASARARA